MKRKIETIIKDAVGHFDLGGVSSLYKGEYAALQGT
jgi:hypothetical protein